METRTRARRGSAGSPLTPGQAVLWWGMFWGVASAAFIMWNAASWEYPYSGSEAEASVLQGSAASVALLVILCVSALGGGVVAGQSGKGQSLPFTAGLMSLLVTLILWLNFSVPPLPLMCFAAATWLAGHCGRRVGERLPLARGGKAAIAWLLVPAVATMWAGVCLLNAPPGYATPFGPARPAGEYRLVWSPTGQELLVAAERPAKPWHWVNLRTGSQVTFSTGARYSSVAELGTQFWRPEQERLVLPDKDGVPFLVDGRTGEGIKLPGPPASRAAVAPNGTSVALLRTISPRATYGLDILELGSSERIEVARDGVNPWVAPCWSPDAGHLGFLHTAGHGRFVTHRIGVVDVAKRRVKLLSLPQASKDGWVFQAGNLAFQPPQKEPPAPVREEAQAVTREAGPPSAEQDTEAPSQPAAECYLDAEGNLCLRSEGAERIVHKFEKRPEVVAPPTPSPDGTAIALVVEYAQAKGSRAEQRPELWLVDLAGGVASRAQVLAPAASEKTPATVSS